MRIASRGIHDKPSDGDSKDTGNSIAPALQNVRLGKQYSPSAPGLKEVLSGEETESLASAATLTLSYVGSRLHPSVDASYWASIHVMGLQKMMFRLSSLGEIRAGDERLCISLRRQEGSSQIDILCKALVYALISTNASLTAKALSDSDVTCADLESQIKEKLRAYGELTLNALSDRGVASLACLLLEVA